MTNITAFFASYYFIAPIVAWLIACIVKAIVRSAKSGKFSLKLGFENGGMPSTHSTIVSAITVAVLLKTGLSELFFVALMFSLIIISDAFGVRQYIGKQGEALNEVLKKSGKKPLKIVYGHTFLQVIVGILWGAAVSIIFYFIL